MEFSPEIQDHSIMQKHLGSLLIRPCSFLVILSLIVLQHSMRAQTLDWGYALEIQNDDAWASGIDSDPDGNVYVAGYFRGTIDLDPGPGVQSATVQTPGQNDAFVVKLDSNGNYIWGRTFGGPTGDVAWTLAVDDSGNSYVAGLFADSIDLDPSQNEDWQRVAGSTFSQSSYILKLDTDGDYVWGHVFGNAFGNDRIYGIEVRDTLVAACGYLSGGGGDFDPGPGTFALTSNGNRDAYFTLFTTSGDFIHAGSMGSSDFEEANDITIDDSLNVYFTGYFQGSTDFDASSSGTFTMNPGIWEDGFVAKYDVNGDFQWARRTGPIGQWYYIGFAIDWSDQGFVMTGGLGRELPFNGSDGYMYLQRYDRNGNAGFFNTLNITNNQGFPYGAIQAITIDDFGNTYISGELQGTADMDAGSGTFDVNLSSSYGFFLASYDTVGDLNWALGVEDSVTGFSLAERVRDLDPDESGNLLLAGTMDGPFDIDLSPTSSLIVDDGSGESSGFIAKYTQCFSGSIDALTAAADSICPNNTVSFSITGNLRSNQNWYWYLDSLGGSPVDSGQNVSLSIANTSQVYARAEGGCAPDSDLDSILITVFDTVSPVPSVASLDTLFAACSITVSSTPEAMDNCSGLLPGTTNDILTYNAQGTYTITWLYEDELGNQVTQDQVIVVDDITAPLPNQSALDTIVGQCSASINATPTAADNCAGAITATTGDALSYTTQGTFTVTWTFDDGNGNVATQPQVVIVDDITAPVPDLNALDTVTGICSATISSTPTATDNCGSSINGTTADPLSYSAQGTHTVTWTFTDAEGNASTQTQVVVVSDTELPVPSLVSLDTIFAACSITVSTIPTASDNCAGTVNATTSNPLTYSVVGDYVINWTYDDGNGNSVGQSQVVSIFDVSAPVPDISALDTVFGQCSASVSTQPTATDNCDGSVTATTSSPLNYAAQGTYTVNWVYTDNEGNTDMQSQVVVVEDTIAPVPSMSSLDTVFGACAASVTATPTAVDNCSGTVNGTTSDPLSYSTQGSYTITWTFTDSEGNSRIQLQQVVVDDTVAPVATLGALDTIFGVCDASILTTPTATDNCDGSIMGTTNDPLSYSTQGSFTVVWTYTDVEGNATTQLQTVVVEDIVAPVPDQLALDTVFGVCSAAITATPSANDNCDGAIIGSTSDPLFYEGDGTYVVSWTFTDFSGNAQQQLQVVVVADTVAPEILCPNGADICGSEASGIAPLDTSDNCSAVNLSYLLDGATQALGSGSAESESFNPGVTTVTYTLEDASGNEATCSLTVTSVIVDVSVSSTTTSITATADATQYQWINCEDNTIIAGASEQTFSPAANGSYAVLVTQSGCVDTSACVTITAVGLANIESQYPRLSLHPNPTATGVFTLRADKTVEHMTVEVRTLTGQLVSQQEWTGTRSFEGVTGMASGVYLIQLRDSENAHMGQFRIVKQ